MSWLEMHMKVDSNNNSNRRAVHGGSARMQKYPMRIAAQSISQHLHMARIRQALVPNPPQHGKNPHGALDASTYLFTGCNVELCKGMYVRSMLSTGRCYTMKITAKHV